MATTPPFLKPIPNAALDKFFQQQAQANRSEPQVLAMARALQRLAEGGTQLEQAQSAITPTIASQVNRVVHEKQEEDERRRKKEEERRQFESAVILMQSMIRARAAQQQAAELRRIREEAQKRAIPLVEQSLQAEKKIVEQKYPLPSISGNALKKKTGKDYKQYSQAKQTQTAQLDLVEAKRVPQTDALTRQIEQFIRSAPPFLKQDTLIALFDLCRSDLTLAIALAQCLPFQENVDDLRLAKSITAFLRHSKPELAQECQKFLERGIKEMIVLDLADFCLKYRNIPLRLWLVDFAAKAKTERECGDVMYVLNFLDKQSRHLPVLTTLLQNWGWCMLIQDLAEEDMFAYKPAMNWLAGQMAHANFDEIVKLMIWQKKQCNDVPQLVNLCGTHNLTVGLVLKLARLKSTRHVNEAIGFCATNLAPVALHGVSDVLDHTNEGTVAADWAAYQNLLVLQGQLANDKVLLHNAVNLLACSLAAKNILHQAIDKMSLAGGFDLSVDSNQQPAVIAEATQNWAGLQNTGGLQLIGNMHVPGGPGVPERKDRGTHWEWTKNLMVNVNGVSHNIHLHPSGWRVSK